MALYKVEKYNTKKKTYKEEYVDVPNSVDFWMNCQKQSAKDGIIVKYISKPTGIRRKVIYALIDFPDGECWQYDLRKKKH